MQAKPLSYSLASPRPTCGRGKLSFMQQSFSTS